MCGIAGVWTSSRAEQSVLDEMARRLAHRGPDGQGFYIADGVGMTHTRLSIIDLAGGGQPLYNEDGSLALVANGEIYNYLELRRELEVLGHQFATHSDCEVILHAYEAWGEGFLDRMLGMFAFALHDSRRGELILVRDRLGIKPLYYAHTAAGLVFASEPKALLPWIGRTEVDPISLGQFFQLNFTCAPRTLLAGVYKLLPGSLLRMGAGGEPRMRRWWSPLTVQTVDSDLDEAMARFDALMNETIDIHLRSDVPLGLFLSGGVDSSLLAALIARRVPEALRTFSVGFPGSSVHNELNEAAEVAAYLGTRHMAIEVTADDMLNRLPHAVWMADDLTADYANLPVSLLAERAGKELKVVFSGEGGDEVFAGYGRYRTPVVKRWLAALRGRGSGGFRTRGMFDSAGAMIANPELAAAFRQWRTPIVDAWQATPKSWTRLQRMQYVDLETWLPDDLLIKADRMLMAWGVEGRVPYLDHRVVEFGLSLPDGMKADARFGKRFLRLWGERFLPRDRLWSRKKGFTVPVRDWLRGERLDRLEPVLSNAPGIRAWFGREAVSQLCAGQRAGKKFDGALWAMLNFALWHRFFIEGDGDAPPHAADPVALLAS